MRVFITGGTGFAGSHLVDQQLAAGNEVYALVHHASSHQELPDHSRLHPIQGDLLDGINLQSAVRAAEPDVIYHLAGQPSPAVSWQDPARTMAINVGGTANILQAAIASGHPRVVVVTSSEVYGRITPDMLPLTEETPVEPCHPYGVSKLATSQLASVYYRRYQLPVIEARPFNHIGPRQALGFVVPDFASQIAAIKLGQQEPVISVGNLDARRDFTDVRDVARAYAALAESGRPGQTYFISSGKPTAIRTLLDTLIELAGVDIQVTHDPARMRPSDTPVVYGSHQRITTDTAWQPQVDIRQSLADALDDWQQKQAANDQPPAS